MKTPIQELIEKLNNVKPTEFCSIETIKGWAESMLEKEKQQIMNAWIEGGECGYLSQESDRVLAEQYYNETFKTNEK